MNIDELVNMMAEAEANCIRLGEMIEVLKELPAEYRISPGLCEPHSYRGYYNCLAFEPCEETTAGELLKLAEACNGETFTGYKGGDFNMHKGTRLYVAEYGRCGDELTPDDFSSMLG